MKKLLALLLAATLALGTAATALAVAPAQPQDFDSGALTIENQAEAGGLMIDDVFTLAELEADIREEYGLEDGESLSAIASYAAVGNYFGDRLSATDKKMYDELVSFFQNIIKNNGGSSRAQFTYIPNASFRNVFYAILKDHTEILYWVEKTQSTVAFSDNEKTTQYVTFQVITKYRGNQLGYNALKDSNGKVNNYYYYNVKPGENNKANAERVAKEIVDYANSHYSTDYQKIRYFNKRICLLTDYNFDALSNNYPYNDTFQWINVFNGDKVVCEGYAKAFKYLCDKAGIGCLIVSGGLGSGTGAGNHMWNLVELDSKWYVVDCTNNDIPDKAGKPSTYSEILLAVGSNNQYYMGYDFDPVSYVDGSLVELNPESDKLSTSDYVPTTADQEPAASSQTVTVENGTAGVQKAEEGDIVTVTANAPAAGMKFKNWTSVSGVKFTNASAATTTFVMIDAPVTVTANFVPDVAYNVTVSNGTANPAQAKQGETVTITANAAPSGMRFSYWNTTTPGVTLANRYASQTTFVMPFSDVAVTAVYTSTSGGGGGSSGGGGGGGGGSPSGGGSSAPSTPTTIDYEITAVAAKAQDAVATAINQALAAKQRTATATIILENAATITPEMMKSVLDTARAASTGKGVTVTPIIACDTVENGSVITRVYIDPAKNTLTTPISVSGSLGNQPVVDMFARYYSNTIKAVRLEHAGAFGMPVNIAAKVDLTGLDTKTLRFYNYNTATNIYTPITAPAYSIDANGYLRFTVTSGNTILIMDKPLTVK